jgi:hypothetical protein
MQNRRVPFLMLVLLLILSSVMCDTSSLTREEAPTSAENYVATLASLQITQTALANQPTAAAPTLPNPPTAPPTTPPTDTPEQFGRLSGNLSYPAEGIPAMRIVAFNAQTDEYYFTETAKNQTAYRFDHLAPALYYIVAYSLDSAIAGGYTKAVLCGLLASCTDHSLVPVQVTAGQETTGINPSDWYAPPGTFPSDPLAPPQAPIVYGSISGKLSYPSEFIPSLRVVAFNISSGQFFYVVTALNQSTYKIENLPPGIYNVIAYASENFGGGYTQAVLCGLSVNCTDHSLIPVQVIAGQETKGIDPGDWYAPQGSFPPMP